MKLTASNIDDYSNTDIYYGNYGMTSIYPTPTKTIITITPEEAATEYANCMMKFRKELHQYNIRKRIEKFIQNYPPIRKLTRRHRRTYSSPPIHPNLPTPKSLKRVIYEYNYNMDDFNTNSESYNTDSSYPSLYETLTSYSNKLYGIACNFHST